MRSSTSTASLSDVPDLVSSIAALFAEDGGRRDPHMDVGWPGREGEVYCTGLVSDPACLCLLARNGPEQRTVGHLIGRMSRADPLRPNATMAVLESMRVDPSQRRSGVGSELVARFQEWAREQRATEASVTAYTSNTAAIAFYRSHGFRPFELTQHVPLS